MGLLGTVTGMISVFDVLAITGTDNARAMANGISQATIPTMAGLVVALTGLYFNTRFKRLSSRAERKLAEQLIIGYLPMARRRTRTEAEGNDIDITPMLDIVFIMLIFFIVTTSFVKERGVTVNRPSAQTAEI